MKQFLRIIGLFFVFVAIIGLFAVREDIPIVFSEPVDIYEDVPENFDNIKAVETEISMLLDKFVEEERITKNDSGAITSRDYDYYYILPVFTKNETYYAAVKVDSEDSATYKRIVDITWEYINGEREFVGSRTVDFQGGFVKMDDELYEYFEDWFRDEQYFENESDIDKYLLPLVLIPVNYERVRVMIYVFVGMLVFGVLFFILGMIPKKKRNTKAPGSSTIMINGINYPSANLLDVNKYVEQGKKVKAIKELRDITNLDLAAAKDIVDNWDTYWSGSTPVDSNSYGGAFDSSYEATGDTINIKGVNYSKARVSAINDMIQGGQVIPAIKEVREMTGLGLAEAKEIVDNWSFYWR